MPLPLQDTVVTFPAGGLADRSTATYVLAGEEQTLLLTERTPFHPVDARWPDQGPDRGVIAIQGRSVPVLDCVVGATDGSALFVGDTIPVRRGEPGWASVVVHVLAAGVLVAEGDEVRLSVDPEHRAALSAGHTGCHLAALALNAVLADRWRKSVGTDGLGSANFDQLAIVSSQIVPNGAIDSYRIGRSLRKKGFDPEGLTSALSLLADTANEMLAGWVATGSSIEVLCAGPTLGDLREWVCTLPEGTQQIPCGGTHLRSLADVGEITVELEHDEAAGELVMRTTVRR